MKVFGTAALILLASSLVGAQGQMSRKEFEKAIARAITANELVRALNLAEQCLAAYPEARKCTESKQSVNHLLAQQWRRYLSSVPPQNLPEIERSLLQIARAENDPTIAPRLESVRTKMQEIKDRGATLVKQLHQSGGIVPATLPADLAAHQPYVAELNEVARELALHQSLQSARNLHSSGKTAEAIRYLDSLKSDDEIRTVRGDMVASLVAESSDAIESALASQSWEGIVKAIDHLASPEVQLLPAETRTGLRTKLAAAMKARVQSLVPLNGDTASVKAVSRVIASKLPPESRPAIDWPALGLRSPGLTITAGASAIDPSCEALTPASIESKLRRGMLSLLEEASDATIKVAIDNVQCAIETSAAGEEPINSTYVASYNQVTNPEYVRLQALLQQAQQELASVRTRNALNPPQNGWQGAGQALAESGVSIRVSTLSRQLSDTPPFLSQPVVLSYTPYRYYMQRTAAIKAVLSVTDPSTGYADALTLTADVNGKADGVRDVLPTDQSNLSNRVPSLPSAATLVAQASDQLLNDAATRLNKYLGRVAVSRAEYAVRAKQPVMAAGYLMLAGDFGVAAEEQGPLASLVQQAGELPLERLNELKAPKVTVRASARQARPIAATANGTRANMLERAMGAVVTISTENGSGSGFFVGNNGQVITNAHVVEGAARIIVRTRTRETVLARVVKLSLNDDLALLTTVGMQVTGLPLGDAEAARIGQDVIAIGSPLGLEGTVTRGIISGIRQIGGIPLLQTDAPINPGNSGGPLLSEQGEVLGINTWKVGKQSESLGFAISVDRMKSVFSGLLDGK